MNTPYSHPKEIRTKDRVLELLRPAGTRRSGEEMAMTLGISRAAVSKQVHLLREAGHLIEAVSSKGYRLLVEADDYTPDTVRFGLRTRVLGQNEWLWLAQTGSTNCDAVALAAAGSPEGSVVVAERQCTGRGRKGKQWFSAPRSLFVSVLLRPDLPPAEAMQLSECACRAAAAAVCRTAHLEVAVKPPNDLLLNGRKVCGVLAELGLRGDATDWIVLGVGINVNVMLSEFPPELRERATSLLAEKGEAVPRAPLLRALLEALEEELEKIYTLQPS